MPSFEKKAYTLFLTEKENKRSIQRKEQHRIVVTFKGVINQNKVPKIYILKATTEIVYVGFTTQAINTRLRAGLTATGKNGYHGYKWKALSKLQLIIYVFEDSFAKAETASIKATNKKKKHFYETIEAELVYQIRQETGQYPLYQNEVHFYNAYLKEVQTIVAQIYTDLRTKP